MKGNRAVVIPVLVYWLAGGAVLSQTVPNWRVWHLWGAKPPTAALIQAQTDLEKAKAEAKIANDSLNAARDAETARKASQLSYGSQMAYGASKALESAPVSPQTALAVSLLNRSNAALTSALGSLPQDKANEIMQIVSQSLSGAADQLSQANATLAIRDKELAVATAERSALQNQIPALQTALETKSKAVEAQSAVVAEKTASVVTYAEKLAAKEKENGGLGSLINNFWTTLEIMAGIATLGYAGFAYVKWKYGGIAGAVGKGLSELRAQHPEAAALATSIFDTHLDRSEQTVIAQHAKLSV